MPRRKDEPTEGKGLGLLDDKLDEVVQLKLVGATDHAIATRMGVARSTVTKFCAKPMVRKQIDQAQHELVMGAVRQAATGARAAINVFLSTVEPSSKAPLALKLKAAAELTRIVGIERMAQSIEHSAETLASDAVRESLIAKAQLAEQRVIEAQAIDDPPAGLRVVDGG